MAYTPFKMRGSPMKRNFGITPRDYKSDSSPLKSPGHGGEPLHEHGSASHPGKEGFLTKSRSTTDAEGNPTVENQETTDYYIGESKTDSISFYNKLAHLKEIGAAYKQSQTNE